MQSRMSTINRKPIKTYVYNNSLAIDWKCHGIDQNGNRQKWTERTFTASVWIETYDSDLFPSKLTYMTTKKIFPPGKFENDAGITSWREASS